MIGHKKNVTGEILLLNKISLEKCGFFLPNGGGGGGGGGGGCLKFIFSLKYPNRGSKFYIFLKHIGKVGSKFYIFSSALKKMVKTRSLPINFTEKVTPFAILLSSYPRSLGTVSDAHSWLAEDKISLWPDFEYLSFGWRSTNVCHCNRILMQRFLLQWNWTLPLHQRPVSDLIMCCYWTMSCQSGFQVLITVTALYWNMTTCLCNLL